MASGKELTPSEYIEHHLTFLTKPVGGEGGFWSINVDSLVTATLLGVISLGFLWWVVRGATSGVPGRRQAFVAIPESRSRRASIEGLSMLDEALKVATVVTKRVPAQVCDT